MTPAMSPSTLREPEPIQREIQAHRNLIAIPTPWATPVKISHNLHVSFTPLLSGTNQNPYEKVENFSSE